MSTINTNSINPNYPTPGVNNNSQGFRDNFASIKTNLNIAATELTDLQNKVVVKQALTGTTLNNDMANTLISNAAIRSFRSTTYNLGNDLSGTVLVDVSLGDVQYGTITANTVLQFGNWAPTGTQSNVQLSLAIANSSAYITFPAELAVSADSGATTIENYQDTGGVISVTAPQGVTVLDYRISTLDCGNTLTIEPYNRPRQATQVQIRDVSPVGLRGDVAGDIVQGTTVPQLTINNTHANDEITTTNTSSLYVDMPIVFTGSTLGGVVAGTTYYINNIPSSTNFTISTTVGGGNVNLSNDSGTMYGNPISYLYVCTNAYDATTYQKTVSGTNSSGNITLNNTSSLVVNAPIVFTGDVVGGLVDGQIYYIKSISGSNIKISLSRFNGVSASELVLTTAAPGNTLTATSYVGSDIWKRLSLTSW